MAESSVSGQLKIFEEFCSRKNIIDSFAFPSDGSYRLILNVLLNQQTTENISRDRKRYLRHHFSKTVINGQWMLKNARDDKFILKQSCFLEQFRYYHDSIGHPGYKAVCAKFKQTYWKAPEELIRKMVKACDVCQTRRPVKKIPAGKAQMAKGIYV